MSSPLPAPIDLGTLSDRSIALCGFMGVGKSTVGRKLALRLDRPFIDVDTVIAEDLGSPIAELFQQGKESLFRASEARIIAELVQKGPPSVIALGGGSYDSTSTRQTLRDHAFVIHLDQSFESLVPSLNRLRSGRPLLAGRSDQEIRELYERRRTNYLLADLSVPLQRAGTSIATREVIQALNRFLDAQKG